MANLNSLNWIFFCFLFSASTTQAKGHLKDAQFLSKKILREAVFFFNKNKNRFQNQNYISIINYGAPSKHKRFFIINLKNGKVWSLHVAHGSGSDPKRTGIPKTFSNKPNSHASSLGFYRATEEYSGKHGKSLRLEGLSQTNSNALQRGIVIHGADYVKDDDVLQGRSQGCPAVSKKSTSQVVDLLKNGSLVFVTDGETSLTHTLF